MMLNLIPLAPAVLVINADDEIAEAYLRRHRADLAASGVTVATTHTIPRGIGYLSGVGLTPTLFEFEAPPTCPGDDCLMCKGDGCLMCGAGLWESVNGRPECDHDTLERHGYTF